MSEDLLMYSPLAEMSALQKLLAGDSGREHQVCSPLQHDKCMASKSCLRHKLKYKENVVFAKTDFRLCTVVRFTAQRMSSTKARKA